MDDTQLQEQQVEETQQAVETQQEPAKTESKPVDTPQEKNLRALREKSERITRERDEALRRLQELESAREIEQDKSLSPAEVEVRKLKQEFQRYKQQSAEQIIEARLKSQYQDFDEVVSRENVAALSEAYPEIAETLRASNDLYKTGVSAYTMIKKFGIHKDGFDADRAKTQQNAIKPRPASSVSPQSGQGALSHANAFAEGLTDELRAQLRREMEDARKSY